jgi:regulator of protease activity HflC (stomatin/prohibitin superfamily)
MKADFLTYKRATGISLSGVVLQTLIAGALGAYGYLAKDQAALTMCVFAGVGAIAWLALSILFDQHRRERIEAMEVEALASTGGMQASVFASGDEHRPAAKRLAGLFKIFVPIVTLIAVGLLVGLGITRFLGFQSLLEVARTKSGSYIPSMHQGWGLGLGLAIAVTCFVFARYAAGMAKQAAWSNLRAGASLSAGTALLGLLLAVVHAIDYVGPDGPARMFPYVVAGFLVLIGIELALHFVLGIYRPRKAGETPRVSFDSRLLGFLAAPDRIAKSISEAVNYQLGFDVTGGWFYKLLGRTVLPLLAAGILIAWALSCFVVVQPHQRAMLLRFGSPVGGELGPGLHFKRPWPIDQVYIPELMTKNALGNARVQDHTVTGLRELQLGAMTKTDAAAILWTNEHAGEEVYQFVRARPEGRLSATEAATEGGNAGDAERRELVDLAMVSVEIPLQYVVSDVRLFDELGPREQRDQRLRVAAVREVTRYFQSQNLDTVLGAERLKISQDLAVLVQRAFDNMNPGADGKPRGAGVRIVYLGLSGVHPPQKTANAFEAVVQSDQRRSANVQAAEADAIRTLTDVVGDHKVAASIVSMIDARDAARSGANAQTAVGEQEVRIQQAIERAGGKASSLLAQARAERWERHMRARGNAERHQGTVALYKAAPDIFRAGEYFNAMTTFLDQTSLIVVPSDSGGLRITIDAQQKDSGIDVFRSGASPPQ